MDAERLERRHRLQRVTEKVAKDTEETQGGSGIAHDVEAEDVVVQRMRTPMSHMVARGGKDSVVVRQVAQRARIRSDCVAMTCEELRELIVEVVGDNRAAVVREEDLAQRRITPTARRLPRFSGMNLHREDNASVDV